MGTVCYNSVGCMFFQFLEWEDNFYMTYCVKNYLLSIGYFYKRHSIQLGHTLTGFAVGSVWRVAYGGAANFLCLPKDRPESNKTNTAATEYRNVI